MACQLIHYLPYYFQYSQHAARSFPRTYPVNQTACADRQFARLRQYVHQHPAGDSIREQWRTGQSILYRNQYGRVHMAWVYTNLKKGAIANTGTTSYNPSRQRNHRSHSRRVCRLSGRRKYSQGYHLSLTISGSVRRLGNLR